MSTLVGPEFDFDDAFEVALPRKLIALVEWDPLWDAALESPSESREWWFSHIRCRAEISPIVGCAGSLARIGLWILIAAPVLLTPAMLPFAVLGPAHAIGRIRNGLGATAELPAELSFLVLFLDRSWVADNWHLLPVLVLGCFGVAVAARNVCANRMAILDKSSPHAGKDRITFVTHALLLVAWCIALCVSSFLLWSTEGYGWGSDVGRRVGADAELDWPRPPQQRSEHYWRTASDAVPKNANDDVYFKSRTFWYLSPLLAAIGLYVVVAPPCFVPARAHARARRAGARTLWTSPPPLLLLLLA